MHQHIKMVVSKKNCPSKDPDRRHIDLHHFAPRLSLNLFVDAASKNIVFASQCVKHTTRAFEKELLRELKVDRELNSDWP